MINILFNACPLADVFNIDSRSEEDHQSKNWDGSVITTMERPWVVFAQGSNDAMTG